MDGIARIESETSGFESRFMAATRRVTVVDTDVHADPTGIEEFAEYVPEPFRSCYYTKHASETYSEYVFYAPPANGLRLDSISLPAEIRCRLLYDNAASWYGLSPLAAATGDR
jgi:hypothetical protein